ncbi:N-acetylmuramoyl-L-alanine amidase [Pseudokineococcus marinus]|uniref:N-acetylmuramoyl-L-alanine amidase n=1 Tax=Pseudokineococcus marinus TaxID=351215 RepID=UPI001BB2ECB2|nr:N-acetylmuramoyl-L-alanine amidase [Pseudokineococcus marinus]
MPVPPHLLRRGDTGPRVVGLREELARAGAPAGADPEEDVFDDALERVVRAFQQERGLRADGVVGPQTSRALDGARWRLGDRVLRFVPGHLLHGDDVTALQDRLLQLGLLDDRRDGRYGPRTEAGVRELQRSSGTAVDGVLGPETLAALRRLDRSVGGGDASGLRDLERTAQARRRASGRVVLLDPAHGGTDRGSVGHGLEEAEVVLDLAQRLEGRLAASGTTAVLSRGADQRPSAEERAELAESVAADVVLSLHCDALVPAGLDAGHALPPAAASGLATFSWGSATARSTEGARLAGLVHRELLARTGLADCRTHTWNTDLLRLTRMPAVRVEVGYLTSPDDAALVRDPAFRDRCAEALAVALHRFFLEEEDDVPTGLLPVVGAGA